MARPLRLNEAEDKEYSPCLGEGESEPKRFKMWGVQRRVALDALMACWGMATWLGVNGLFVQLPLLVERAPEGWALPSAMTLAVAAANAGLLLYALLKRLLPRVPDAAYIYALLLVGLSALVLNAFLHTNTVSINGEDRSIPFLVLTFFTGLVGCTSSVVFYPYLRHFKDIYLSTYLVGEGLSGFLPSIFTLIQGVGGEPECVPSADNSSLVPIFPPARFDSMVYMLILSGLSLLSLVAFVILDRSPIYASERVDPAVADKTEEGETAQGDKRDGGEVVESDSDKKLEGESLLRADWLGVIVLMGVMNALMNGVLPSVQSYSCMPYGTQTYHLAVTLSTMANPLACLAGVWLKPIAARALAAVLAVSAVPYAYIMATALLSPTPPLINTGIGEFLVVLSWVWVMSALSYGRMWVYGWARRGGARGMRAIGAVGQAGSAGASVALFLIVNYANVFTEADRCPVTM